MEALVTIGSIGLDLIHLVLLLAAIALAVALFVIRGKLGAEAHNARRDLEYAEDSVAALKAEREELRQQVKTKDAVAEQARIDLAKAEARSDEDEKKFAELAQGVLRRANTQCGAQPLVPDGGDRAIGCCTMPSPAMRARSLFSFDNSFLTRRLNSGTE